MNSNNLPHLAPRCHCTGCGACVDACATGAISMIADNEGFWYPQVSEACVGCSKCENVCPADDVRFDYGALAVDAEYPKAFWAYQNDRSVCNESSSGGMFNALATAVLNQGGVVIGVGYDKDFNVRHMVAESLQELRNLQTSKYVQSDAAGIYCRTKQELVAGRQILFSGTPCQIAALKSYLGQEYDNLLTVDLICHGVPSPMVWKQYLQEAHGGVEAISAVNFRDKTLGWNNFSMRIGYKSGAPDYLQEATKDSFERGFLANLFLRPVCHQCQYKTVQRCSDITLADYWGVELVHPELADQQGVSLVLAQTEKGAAFLLNTRDSLLMGKTDRAKAISMNSGAISSVKPHPKRTEFFERFNRAEEGFETIVNDCLRIPKTQQTYRVFRRAGSKVKRMVVKK